MAGAEESHRADIEGEAGRMLVICAQRIEASRFCSCLQVLAFRLRGMGCSEVSHAGRILQEHLLFTGAGW